MGGPDPPIQFLTRPSRFKKSGRDPPIQFHKERSGPDPPIGLRTAPHRSKNTGWPAQGRPWWLYINAISHLAAPTSPWADLTRPSRSMGGPDPAIQIHKERSGPDPPIGLRTAPHRSKNTG